MRGLIVRIMARRTGRRPRSIPQWWQYTAPGSTICHCFCRL